MSENNDLTYYERNRDVVLRKQRIIFKIIKID